MFVMSSEHIKTFLGLSVETSNIKLHRTWGMYPPGCNLLESLLTVTIQNTWFHSAFTLQLLLLQKSNRKLPQNILQKGTTKPKYNTYYLQVVQSLTFLLVCF
jgi:hypothetical protein